MAVADAYASAPEFRERTVKGDTGDDATILDLLKAVSRLIDRECERFFGIDAAVVVRLYEGNGLTRLYIDDVATVTGLIVKADLDDDYAFTGATETLTKDTHYWIGPANAALGPEASPYRFLDIVPANSVLNVWPDGQRKVQVTAKFGWPSVPPAIKEATILVTRELRDLEGSGFTLSLQNIDAGINLSPVAFSIIQRIKAEYGRRRLFV